VTSEAHTHAGHPDIIKRLRRADGHLRSVIEMLEQDGPCLDIAQQLLAVEKAIVQAKKALIHDHMDHCLDAIAEPLANGGRVQIDAFKLITKYL
jgi:DNA-binding FrmR family transcriptional regulator